jgi:hypothetical protein
MIGKLFTDNLANVGVHLRHGQLDGSACFEEESELPRDQLKATVAGGLTQLPVPAGELELFAGGERECASEVDGVVGTKRMRASALSRLCQQFLANGVNVKPTPKALQLIQSATQLCWGQAAPLAHAG